MDKLRKYRILYLAAIIALFALDQASKSWAVKNLGESGSAMEIIPGYLEFKLIYNTGAAWGMFSGWTQGLAVMSGIMIIVIMTVLGRTSLKDRFLGWALSFQLGGAFGNLYDRLSHRTGVVDFIHMYIPLGGGPEGFWQRLFESLRWMPVRDFVATKIPFKYDWPVFNVADSSVVIGTILLLVYILSMPPEKHEEKPATAISVEPVSPTLLDEQTKSKSEIKPNEIDSSAKG